MYENNNPIVAGIFIGLLCVVISYLHEIESTLKDIAQTNKAMACVELNDTEDQITNCIQDN